MTYTLTDEWGRSQAARAVPGSYYDRDLGAWIVKDPTPRAAAVMVRLFPRLVTTNPELLELRASLVQNVRPIDHATEYFQQLALGDQSEIMDFAERVEPQLHAEGKDFYEYQLTDLVYLSAVLEQHGAAYLGWDRGLGKTLGACALIDELDCQRTLIVCPNTAKQAVWEAELRRWCPWLKVHVLPNDKAKRERMMATIKDFQAPRGEVLVIHYEALGLIAKERAAGRGWDRYGEWDMVVADETHRIKNPQAQMTKALKRIKTRYKLALSGSIIENHLEELFSQLQWLFPDRYSSKWRDWNDRYLDYVDSGFAQVCVGVRIERLAELRDELGRFMVYRRKEDELDLPERTDEVREVDLSPAQRRVYDDLVDSYVAELGEFERPLVAQDGLVLLTRLRQVATGLDLVSGDLADSSKQDLAVELITDTPDEAFVVFSWFKQAAYSIAARLQSAGIDVHVVTGDTAQARRAASIAAFQAGEGRVFIGTIGTLAESVTLHRANNVIFLDRAWNPAKNQQAEDRVYRIGQGRPVTITHIVARDTVDATNVAPTLTDKQALRQMILGGTR